MHKRGSVAHTINSSGGFRSSCSLSVVSQSIWCSLAMSFRTFSLICPEGFLTDSFSISFKRGIKFRMEKNRHKQYIHNSENWLNLRWRNPCLQGCWQQHLGASQLQQKQNLCHTSFQKCHACDQVQGAQSTLELQISNCRYLLSSLLDIPWIKGWHKIRTLFSLVMRANGFRKLSDGSETQTSVLRWWEGV